VDPLDGTKEFLKHNGEFTVNIALIAGNAPVMGVLHVPVTGETFFAVQGRGAFVRRKVCVGVCGGGDLVGGGVEEGGGRGKGVCLDSGLALRWMRWTSATKGDCCCHPIHPKSLYAQHTTTT